MRIRKESNIISLVRQQTSEMNKGERKELRMLETTRKKPK
jgi:hypothetical protein